MALGVPSSSPAVIIKEVDASASIQTAATTIGGSVGNFRWGPVGTPVTISTETELANTFGNPDDAHSIDFHSVAYYLRYADNLKVVRATNATAKNAHDADQTGTDPAINTAADWDTQISARDSDKHTFIAKWPGAMGNSLKVEVCPASSGDSAFNGWTHKGNFDAAPGTSTYASARSGQFDEAHVAVIDEDGSFADIGTVLEVFPFVSLASDAKAVDGASSFIKEVVNNGTTKR